MLGILLKASCQKHTAKSIHGFHRSVQKVRLDKCTHSYFIKTVFQNPAQKAVNQKFLPDFCQCPHLFHPTHDFKSSLRQKFLFYTDTGLHNLYTFLKLHSFRLCSYFYFFIPQMSVFIRPEDRQHCENFQTADEH